MIRLATMQDMPSVLSIYESARQFMKHSGNPTQWGTQYPQADIVRADIEKEQLYIIEYAGQPVGCFVMAAGPDPTYQKIYEGSWGLEQAYGVLHRVAGNGSCKGIVEKAVQFALRHFNHLRIDTHEKNIPMQKALLRQGFTYRGVILTRDATPRLAYDLYRSQ